MTVTSVEIPMTEVFHTFCLGCCEIVEVPFVRWDDQQAALQWAIAIGVIVACPGCGKRVRLDMPRAA